MKKAIKGLIVASAVAAVVGVGAVSYAAWSAGDAATAAATGATGQIVTIGSITATPTGLSGKKLVPYDQPESGQWDADAMTKSFSVKVEYTAATGTPTITMKAEGKADSENNIGALDITKLEYCKTATGTYTAFAANTPVDLTSDLENGQLTYYFRLNSDKTTDMNKGFTITFTAAA